MVLISLATLEDLFVDTASYASSLYQSLMAGVETTGAKSSDDEEISNEEMIHSYKVMYERLVEALNENKVLHKHISQYVAINLNLSNRIMCYLTSYLNRKSK